MSSMYSDEEEDDDQEIVASSDDDEQESPEDYCKGSRRQHILSLSVFPARMAAQRYRMLRYLYISPVCLSLLKYMIN